MYKDRLVDVRENAELKQYDIANYLNLYKGTYNQYETEYKIIPLKYLITLCDYFNISLDYVFNLSDTAKYKNYYPGFDIQKIGTRLKTWRKSINLTQKELASFLNTTQSVIADYERGRYLIATPFLYTICKEYKISADYLLGKID